MKPTWRKPVGVLGLLIALMIYATLVARLLAPIDRWPVLAQTAVYIVLGTIWLVPQRRFLIWMETGKWRE